MLFRSVMPHGVATMGTILKFGATSGMAMRVATSNAMEHMSPKERFMYSFLNPGATLLDMATAGFMYGGMNYAKLNTPFPSQSLVSQYNSQQSLIQAGMANQRALLAAAENRQSPKPSNGQTEPPSIGVGEVEMGKLSGGYPRHINGSIAEIQGYRRALSRGEIGVQPPGVVTQIGRAHV